MGSFLYPSRSSIFKENQHQRFVSAGLMFGRRRSLPIALSKAIKKGWPKLNYPV
jgi:hypothetical protein